MSEFWCEKCYLVINKFSMIPKELFATLEMLFELFQTVIILREQVRVTDPVWLEFLCNLQQGTVHEEHIEMLRRLTLTQRECEDVPDFDSPP